MSELFEEDDGIEDLVEDFEPIVQEDIEVGDIPKNNVDARRRLEQMLEDKRLRTELDDFDY